MTLATDWWTNSACGSLLGRFHRPFSYNFCELFLEQVNLDPNYMKLFASEIILTKMAQFVANCDLQSGTY